MLSFFYWCLNALCGILELDVLAKQCAILMHNTGSWLQQDTAETLLHLPGNLHLVSRNACISPGQETAVTAICCRQTQVSASPFPINLMSPFLQLHMHHKPDVAFLIWLWLSPIYTFSLYRETHLSLGGKTSILGGRGKGKPGSVSVLACSVPSILPGIFSEVTPNSD